jgi:hypothetical protein
MFCRNVLLTASIFSVPFATAVAAEGPPDGSTAEQQALIANDPPFHSVALKLDKSTKSKRQPRSLFNGRDLTGWDTWLGYTVPLSTYGTPSSEPIGLNHDKDGVFRVVREDGQPTLYASGKLFGGLLTRQSYSNYHLHLQFKWGEHNWMPFPRNNGVLYHSHGRYGAFFGTWMSALEFEIVPHSVGMLLTVGDSKGTHSFSSVDWRVGADVEAGHDPSIAYPNRRFMPGGRLVAIKYPAYNVEAGVDAERPLGEWNTLDLYVFGDKSIHVVNGVPVMVASNLTTTDEKTGKRIPLTAGRIQLQSEGAETFFRDIQIEKIDQLPHIKLLGEGKVER